MILTNLELISFKIALILCAISTVGYLSSLLVKKVKLAKISTWILATAFCFLTVNLLFVIYNSSWLINPDSRDFLSLCAWSVCAVYLALQFKTKTRVLGAFISPIILLFMIAAAGEEAENFFDLRIYKVGSLPYICFWQLSGKRCLSSRPVPE